MGVIFMKKYNRIFTIVIDSFGAGAMRMLQSMGCRNRHNGTYF